MSKFYGILKGQDKNVVTRRGSEKSGISASVQSYDGSVITRLNYTDKNVVITIETSDTSSTYGEVIFNGTIKELKKKLS